MTSAALKKAHDQFLSLTSADIHKAGSELDVLEARMTEIESAIDSVTKAHRADDVEDDSDQLDALDDDTDQDDTDDDQDDSDELGPDDEAYDDELRGFKLNKATKFQAMVDHVAQRDGVDKASTAATVRR